MTLAGHIFVYFSESNFFAGAKFNNGLTRAGGGGGGCNSLSGFCGSFPRRSSIDN